MSSIRLLVGTKKGDFVLTSDGKRSDWTISAPTSPRATLSAGVERESAYQPRPLLP